MSLIVSIVKNIWPLLTVGDRNAISRATYITTETSLPLSEETGEVITIE